MAGFIMAPWMTLLSNFTKAPSGPAGWVPGTEIIEDVFDVLQ